MAKGQTKDDVLYRTEKWELKLDAEQERIIIRISDGLREIYNWGREQWMAAYKTYRDKKKVFEQLPPEAQNLLRTLVKAGAIEIVDPSMMEAPPSVDTELWEKMRANAVAFPLPKLPTFFDQVNQLTAMKRDDEAAGLFRARIPRNWKEETLDALHGSLASFFALAKKGDRDARPPKPRDELRFSAIPGRSGFSIKSDARDKHLVLAPNIFKGEEELSFPIPGEYQAMMLARASKELKFIISRDEPWLAKPGRYWISLSYEIPKPETKPFVLEEVVYVALGASSIGVVSSRGEEVIPLWRSDKHWKPEADTVETFLKGRPRSEVAAIASGKPRANCRPALTKGSKKWRRLQKSRGEMFRIMGAQQTQDRREVVAIDLIEKVVDGLVSGHGVHFVVSELVVRSKEGKLADASKEERGGPLGLNWAAQNTGSIGYLVRWLEEKAPEFGGTVRKHKLPYEALPESLVEGYENKIPMAHALRDDFLRSYESAA